MTEAEVLELIKNGESITVELKKSTHEITKDVYDTVGMVGIFFLA